MLQMSEHYEAKLKNRIVYLYLGDRRVLNRLAYGYGVLDTSKQTDKSVM